MVGFGGVVPARRGFTERARQTVRTITGPEHTGSRPAETSRESAAVQRPPHAAKRGGMAAKRLKTRKIAGVSQWGRIVLVRVTPYGSLRHEAATRALQRVGPEREREAVHGVRRLYRITRTS